MSSASYSYSARRLSHPGALMVIEAAAREAKVLSAAMSIAVVDSSAALIGFLKMDGAFLVSSELSQKKARCAASLGFDPQTGDEVLKDEHPRVREGLLLHPDYIEIRGGLPIIEQGELIGAIGVSGGSEEQDLACAQAGVVALSF